jgi:putative SOS response-associated peptidase YedK
MCGRFALEIHTHKLKSQFSLTDLPELRSRYNISPTQQILFLVSINDEIHAELFQWGLIPFFAKDKKVNPPLINARAETLFEKPAFRHSVKAKRGLIVMSGFYEWHGEGNLKQPYYFKHKNNDYLAIAAFWDLWQSNEETIHSCCLVTTVANSVGTSIHPRMPVILTKDEQALWMDNSQFDKDQLKLLMHPYSHDDLVCYPVTTAMNNSRFESSQAILPIT